MKYQLVTLLIFSLLFSSQSDAKSHQHPPMDVMNHDHHSHNHRPSPIGVVGSAHHEGFMLSIKQGLMSMNGNISDGNNISNEKILEVPNEIGEMPTNLSVIPENMDMKMTMIEGMYTATNNLSLMVMATYLSKEMKLSTYSSMMERELIGHFNTSTNDLSDITMSALFKISENKKSRWLGEISFQKSLGSADETAEVLTPMGTKIEMIMPYAMQSGDKATTVVLGLTNTRNLADKIIWGNQIRRRFVANEPKWSFGDQSEINSWLQYSLSKSISLSTRLHFVNQDNISGRDPMIVAPVQTANPDNYGGRELHFGIGLNLGLNILPGGTDLLGFELLAPLIQKKANLQMKTDYRIILGYKKHLSF